MVPQNLHTTSTTATSTSAKNKDYTIVSTIWHHHPESVPYDAIKTSDHISGTGLGGTTHRYRTLGHDPLLGWIFGTANIMTNSLTKADLKFTTYQVKNMTIIRHYPLGCSAMLCRAIEYARKDPKLFLASIARQAVHFGSDYFTKQGLPLPLIASVNNDLAKTMLSNNCYLDMWSVTRQASFSMFINSLIAYIHFIFFNGTSEMDRRLYEVRTRKILKYSNTIASGYNVFEVALTRDLTRLDLGGLAGTIYRIITDTEFIRQVKHDFIFGSYKNMIMNDE